MPNHKVLVIGPLNEGALAESYARAFERLGMEVARFDSEVALRQAIAFCAAPCDRPCGTR
jgi:2-keto-3-deoxy-galactonokinase